MSWHKQLITLVALLLTQSSLLKPRRDLVAKNTMDTEIRLAKEQLELTEEITEEKIMDCFLKEVLAQS